MLSSTTKRIRLQAALLGATVLSGAAPAMAQVAAPEADVTIMVAGPQEASGPQQTPAAGPAAAEGRETVIVTGFRQALIASTEAKRDSAAFTDSVFAEDIGKFPDLNLAESLNRIPGVQLTREINGDGLNVSVRGLGTNFTKVLLNGAQIAVASSGRTDSQNQNREVDLDLFPSELFTRLDVNKTPMASMVEGGVAGVVNMRSARPFDYTGNQLIYSIEGSYGTSAEEISPRASVIASGRWDVGQGEFGALVGVAAVRNKSRVEGFETIGWTNANLSDAQCGAGAPTGASGNPCNQPFGGNGFNIPTTVPANAGNGLVAGTTIDAAFLTARNPGTSLTALGNGLLPRLGRDSLSEGDRDRNSALLSLEYQPFENLNFYFDALYGDADRKFERIDMNWVVRNSNFMVPLNVKVDSNNVVTEGTFANAQFFLEARPYEETVDFFNINPGMTWKPTDWLRLDGQVNLSNSIFFRQAPTILINTPLNTGVTVTYSNPGSSGFPAIDTNVNLNDPGIGWTWAGGRVNIQNERRKTRTSGTHWDLTVGNEDKISAKVGVAYDKVSRRIEALDNSARWQNAVCGGLGATQTPTSALPSPQPACNGATGSLIPQTSLASYLRPGDLGFITVDFAKFFKDSNFSAFNSAAPFSNSAATGANSGLIEESTKGAYVEVNAKTPLLGRDLRVNAGVRYAETDQDITGPQTINGQLSFLTLSQTYGEFLPAFNAVWEVWDNINVRMAASRTLTRPNPSAMLPGTNFSDPSAQTASQGNPSLAPYISTNFDFGAEWYTGGEGYVGIALFNKEITGFTVNGTNTIPFLQLGVPFDQLTQLQQQAINNRGGPNAATVTVTQQVNANGVLEINGAELTWVQPLDFVLEGLGFTANYTQIDQTGSGTGAPAQAVGISPETYNVTAYYERGPGSVRLSYVWNDAQISSGPGQNGVPIAQLMTDARGQWDLSASYELSFLPTSPRITFDAINITDEDQRQTFQYPNAAFTYYKPGSTFLVGVRGKF